MDREPLIAELKKDYGPLLGLPALMSLLDFKTNDSCLRALRSGVLGVPAFKLPGRPGHFVLTEDFVDWLLEAKAEAQRNAKADIPVVTEDSP